jgi:hypothetical protein
MILVNMTQNAQGIEIHLKTGMMPVIKKIIPFSEG